MSELFGEFEQILKESVSDVEKSLAIEGWVKLGSNNMSDLTGASRSEYVKKSRYLYNFDPLAKQSIRLWTDYSFGSGISWNSDNEGVKAALDKFWQNKKNRSVLSAKGQRKSSDKALTDGEVFFALFLGPDGEVTIRWIDPLEITEAITDPDDIEDVRYYKREWTNAQNQTRTSYYRSHTNMDDEATPDSTGKEITATEDAIVYHVAFNSIGQRGNPLLLPVIGWIEQYRLFLAARIAIIRALARFAWATKTKGGAAAVAAVKAAVDGVSPRAGSNLVTNEAVQVEPIKTDTGSANASTDGRMLKLQICAGVGIPEQYYGDIATGNLATARTVELPMLKQFGSYQQIWADVWIDIFNIVLDHNRVSEDDRFIDVDMPEIAPSDAVAAVTAIGQIITSFPDLAEVDEVIKQALMNIGLNNVNEIIEKMKKSMEENKQKKAENLAKMPAEMQNQAGQPPVNNQEQQDSAEVRAIKALVEIRDKINVSAN
jgi:hypothetical protein